MAKNIRKEVQQPGISFYSGSNSLGNLVRGKLGIVNQDIKLLEEKRESVVFATLGEIINSWFKGEVKFVAAGDVSVSGDPGKTLALIKNGGFSINELKELKGKKFEDVLPVLHSTVADLTYLLLKNLIIVEEITYKGPDFVSVNTILDINDIRVRFPEVDWLPETIGRPVESVAAAIVVVDAVVLVLDYARTKA